MKLFWVVALFIILISACSSPTSLVPPAPPPTDIPTPLMPTPTRDPYSLKFLAIPEQIAFRGESFLPINLYGFLRYRSLTADQMTWTVASSSHVITENQNGVVFSTLPDNKWNGSEKIAVKACESETVCAEQEMTFSRLDENATDHVRVIFIGNAGFMISAGDKKVIIDGLFTGFPGNYNLPQYVQDYLINGIPPFDHVDLILATHNHADHFDANVVRQYLEKNPDTVFISTSQATSQLAGFDDRVIAADPKTGSLVSLETNGIQVKTIFISHGIPDNPQDEIFNNGYIINLNGIKIFHTGDIAEPQDITPYNLVAEKINLAFIPHFFLSNNNAKYIIEKTIGVGTSTIFPIHYEYTTPPPNIEAIQIILPDAIGFHSELESWIMP